MGVDGTRSTLGRGIRAMFVKLLQRHNQGFHENGPFDVQLAWSSFLVPSSASQSGSFFFYQIHDIGFYSALILRATSMVDIISSVGRLWRRCCLSCCLVLQAWLQQQPQKTSALLEASINRCHDAVAVISASRQVAFCVADPRYNSFAKMGGTLT